MKNTKTLVVAAAAFAAGAFAARWMPTADAQGTPPAPLEARIIDINAYEGEAIGPITPNTELRTRILVATKDGTVQVQQGNVPRHTHATADEIQYIIAGTGTTWLGDRQVPLKPGDLVVIPRGTVHAGTVPTSGTFKAIAIKLPPQAPGDTLFVP